MLSKNTVTPSSLVSDSNIVERDKIQFYKLMTPELKQLYELKLLDAPAYILLIVKTRRAAGWKWTFKVKDFCQEWGIATPTFYRAVSKLKTLGLLHWETGETITVWHSTDIAKDANSSLPDETILSQENSLTDENQSITRENGSITDDNGFSAMIRQTPETFTSNDLHNTPDIIQINSDQSNNIVVERCAFENKEEEATRESLLTEVLVNPAPLVIPKVAPSPVVLVDERDAINEIRRLGIERNESVLTLLKKYDVNVPGAIAYIQQRQGKGEIFSNITGAFVDALKKGNSPSHTEPSFGLHKDINPPTEQQVQALEDARGGSLILDYFFSSIDNTYKVVLLDGITQVPWWQYLDT